MSNSPDLSHLPLPGSERAVPAPAAPAPAAPAQVDVPAGTRIEATLVLRRPGAAPDPSGGVIPRAEFVERYGASAADVDLVTATLTQLGAEIVAVDAGSRRVRIAGSADVLGRIFGTSLQQGSSPGPDGAMVSHRQRTGGLSIPAALDGVVTAVLGLDDRPQARAHFRVIAHATAEHSYTPIQLGAVYEFPAGTDGTGQTVAIIELGGGYDAADLATYFSALGLSDVAVRSVSVDGADNAPGQGADPSQGADGEVMLDIEVVGALAPRADIAVYFAPNTDAGFLDAISTAAHADPTPVAISISWGQSEDQWTAQARTAMDDALADAVTLGATVTAAAGDNGSSDAAGGDPTGGSPHVDFPASSPHVLACGGTSLAADPSTGTVQSETVWNDGSNGGATGGGVSDVFPLPTWQRSAAVPSRRGATGRGVPDVAADADPQTGYQVRVDGKDLVIGGTSAVAPLWAALVARLAQSAGKPLGLIQPVLYAGSPNPLRDITTGSNGDYAAGAGWDACTGLGVPRGEALRALFGAEPAEPA